MTKSEKIILETTEKPTFAVIWLHGLGADGNDFVSIAKELNLPADLAIRFVFPHAPVMPVTVNGGYQMRAWYDIKTAKLMQDIDLAGIEQSVNSLNTLIEEQNDSGITTDKIILAGFSQGGVIALATALKMKDKPLGVLALSTYLAEKNMAEAGGLNIFQGHGIQDDVVPHSVALETRDYLKSLGLTVDWHEYPMGHSVNLQEIKDIRAWLLKRFHE